MSLVTSVAEAERALDDLRALIEKLAGLLEQETELVRAGKVSHTVDLGRTKATLAHELYTAGERLKANAKYLMQAAPARCTALRRAQEAFRAVVQKNMIVLATTHAVSEGIMRRLSGDLAKKASPEVYGATGRASVPKPRDGRPLAISRML
jgi:hypothetical protein